MKINSNDAIFLIQNIVSSESTLVPLFVRLASSFNGSHLKIPYVDALAAIQTLLKATIKQYQVVERLGTVVAMKDTSKKQ